MTTQVTIDVRYPDCDMMGIVHHSVYALWYEIARMDFFGKMGFSFADMHTLGIDPPMVNLNMQYRAPVRYPGRVQVNTYIKSYAPKKIELVYQVLDGEGKDVAGATSFHIWTGPNGKSLDLEQNLPEVYAKIQAAYEPHAD